LINFWVQTVVPYSNRFQRCAANPITIAVITKELLRHFHTLTLLYPSSVVHEGTTTTTTTTVLWPFVQDYPGEVVSEKTFTHSHI